MSRAWLQRGPLAVPVATLVIVVAAAAAGAGAWFAIGQASRNRAAGRGNLVSAGRDVLAGPGQLVGGRARCRRPAPPGLVSLAPATALLPRRDAIEGVINRYFQAINGRDYAAYQATQSPGYAMTASQFQTGFESTGIRTCSSPGSAAGRTGAGRQRDLYHRQQPNDGPEGESCTNWRVMMFLDGSAGAYTIGAPLNGYKAAYQACSG